MAVMSARDGRAPDADADRPVRLAAPSLKAVVRIVAIVVACALFLYLAWRMRDVLRLVVISVFVALALLPVVDAIDTHVRVPRAAVILALYAALAAGVVARGAAAGAAAVPAAPVPRERRRVSRDVPGALGRRGRPVDHAGNDRHRHRTNPARPDGHPTRAT
jgi:hypothetical protein